MKMLPPALLMVALAALASPLLAQPAPVAAPATPPVQQPEPVVAPKPVVRQAPTPGAADPVVGDTLGSVISALGSPNGVIPNQDKTDLYIFDRGTVLITDGKVSAVKLTPVPGPDAPAASPNMPIIFTSPAPAVAATPSVPSAPAVAPVVAPAPPARIPPTPGAPDPVVGDPLSAVIAALGSPNGNVSNPDNSVLLIYDRGFVLIADNKVAEVKLMSPAAFAAKQAAADAASADRAAQVANANALLQVLLSDPSYLSLSTRDRMAALAKFDREHPGSDAPKHLADLSAVYSVEQLDQAHVDALNSQLGQLQQQNAADQGLINDLKQKAALAQAQSDVLNKAASNASAQARAAAGAASGTAYQSPLVVPNANRPYANANSVSSKSGGGVVLAPQGFGVTTAPAANQNPPGAPSPNPEVQGPHFIVGPDGHTIQFVNGPAQ